MIKSLLSRRLMKMLRVSAAFLILLFIGRCTFDNPTTNSGEYDKYAFFVAGHVYGTPGVDNAGVHPPFRAKFDLIKSDSIMQFGVFTGDIVIWPSEQDWDDVDRDIDSLGIPVYFAVGNHDITNRTLYNERYGDTYYSFSINDDLMIVLDPNLDQWNISGDQLNYLADILNTAGKYQNIFVFFHQLLWWDSENIFKDFVPNSLDGRADSINFRSEVLPLFENLSNPVYMFAGDIGAFSSQLPCMYYENESIHFIASGMGSIINDNFVIINVHEDKTVDFQLVALYGEDIEAMGDIENYTPTDSVSAAFNHADKKNAFRPEHLPEILKRQD